VTLHKPNDIDWESELSERIVSAIKSRLEKDGYNKSKLIPVVYGWSNAQKQDEIYVLTYNITFNLYP
jgi:hypothetical protein